ncbi:hypothetical protein F5141DRAFT_1014443 [Pisolithus sp. B1]|nr:hypothetical protein F5141DRAFT_1014443 [Pisolithus sp. B1]
MSAIIIFGFFALTNGECLKTVKPGSATVTHHCIYETTIQCTSGAVFPAMLQVYSPFNDVALLDNTVAYVSAKVFIPASIADEHCLQEGVFVAPIPSDPCSEDYEHGIPDFPYPTVVGLGLVMTQACTLPDSTSKAFSVVCTDYVHDMSMTSTVMYATFQSYVLGTDDCCYVFDSACTCWSKTPVPNQNSFVHYFSWFSDATPVGSLQVDLQSIALNVGTINTRPSVSTSVLPASKKQKSLAVTPQEWYAFFLFSTFACLM